VEILNLGVYIPDKNVRHVSNLDLVEMLMPMSEEKNKQISWSMKPSNFSFSLESFQELVLESQQVDYSLVQ
jgi:hypothetical protein